MRLSILVISYLIFSAADAYPLLGFLKSKTPAAAAAPAKPQLSRQNAGISKNPNQQNAAPPTSQPQPKQGASTSNATPAKEPAKPQISSPKQGASTSNANAPKRTTLQDLLNQHEPAAATPPTPRPNPTPNKPNDSSKVNKSNPIKQCIGNFLKGCGLSTPATVSGPKQNGGSQNSSTSAPHPNKPNLAPSQKNPSNVPSLKQANQALDSGSSNIKKNGILKSKPSNFAAVKNSDGQVFAVDQKKKIGSGEYGSVHPAYELTPKKSNNPNPGAPIVMKTSTITQAEDPRHADRKQPEIKDLHPVGKQLNVDLQQRYANHEHEFNEKAGLAAGKPTVALNRTGSKIIVNQPMFKVDGNTLTSELKKKGVSGVDRMSSKDALNKAAAAIDHTNNNLNIQHNDAHPDNILLNKKGATLIDYQGATDKTPGVKHNGDHQYLIDSLTNMNDHNAPSNRLGKFPLERQQSINNALADYKKRIQK